MVTRAALILMCLGLAAGAQTGGAQTKANSSAKSATPGKAATKATSKAAPKGNPTAIIHTTAGDMSCTLFADRDPKAVANFVGLAKGTKPWKDPNTGKLVHGKPLYDGVIFHRTIPEFVIQAGDPTGTGSGDPGFTITDQLHPDLLYDQPGRLGMANIGADPATSSSQFFITEKEIPFLNPCLDEGGCPQLRRGKGTGYIIFGQCDDSTVELVKKIARMPCGGGVCTGTNSRPQNPVKITHIDIKSAGSPAEKAAPKKPAAKTATPAATAPPKK
jgi:peptidyl-prolyl cis-trans isomerase A (cyclophilin A)